MRKRYDRKGKTLLRGRKFWQKQAEGGADICRDWFGGGGGEVGEGGREKKKEERKEKESTEDKMQSKGERRQKFNDMLQWYINTWGVKRDEWRRSAQCIT